MMVSQTTKPLSTIIRPNNSMQPQPQEVYDVIIIGGGSAGLTAAKFASNVCGKKTILIEKERLGGDCTWTGCIPSKSLIASARQQKQKQQMILHSSSSKKMGATSSATADWSLIQERFRNIQQEIYQEQDSPQALSKLQINVLAGKACLLSPNTVQVEVNQNNNNNNDNNNNGNDDTGSTIHILQAKLGILLCTGAKPKLPDKMTQFSDDDNDDDKNQSNGGDGFDAVDYVTYEQVWDMKELPKRFTIVGGGPIGCELAQAFARLGSNVTIITGSSQRLLPKEEPEVSKLLQEVFEQEEGITVLTGRVTKVQPLNKDENRTLQGSRGHVIWTSTGQQVMGDVVLVSVGRIPVTRDLGLETLGIQVTSSGGIAVNDKLETTCKGIYAAGDCTGDQQFTHYAGFQGAIAARNICLPLSDKGVLSNVPSVTFTSPEIASVGMTQAQAEQELGSNKLVGVSIMHLDQVDRALSDFRGINLKSDNDNDNNVDHHPNPIRGIFKILYHHRTGKILGGTIMAPSAGEMISELCVARQAGMKMEDLAKVMHPYPSYAITLQLMAANVYYEKTKQWIWLYDMLKRLGL